jgi:hypothetical protein
LQKNQSDYLSDILDDENTKISVYVFINMWTFLVELAAIEEQEAGKYPETLFHMVKCQMKLWKKL